MCVCQRNGTVLDSLLDLPWLVYYRCLSDGCVCACGSASTQPDIQPETGVDKYNSQQPSACFVHQSQIVILEPDP